MKEGDKRGNVLKQAELNVQSKIKGTESKENNHGVPY